MSHCSRRTTVSISSGDTAMKPPGQYLALLPWIVLHYSPHELLPMILSNSSWNNLVFLVLIAFCHLPVYTPGSLYFVPWVPYLQAPWLGFCKPLLGLFPHFFQDSQIQISLISPAMTTPLLHWLPRGRKLQPRNCPGTLRLPMLGKSCKDRQQSARRAQMPMDLARVKS